MQQIAVKLYVQPNAKEFEYCGLFNGCFKFKIPVPALEGKANAYICKAMAKDFSVPLSQVSLSSGQKSRYKTVEIKNPKDIPDWYNGTTI